MSDVKTGPQSAAANDGETSGPVAEAIRSISHIATLPEITQQILELVEDPSSTAQDLHSVIANDPALCSRILKVVNSSFYGLPGQIGSINRAIVLLGLNAVKNIAISASMAKLFKGGQICPAFTAADLWRHSVSVGAAAKLVADEAGIGVPDEAFLAGLMHDIGLIVEIQFDRQKFIQVVEQVMPKPDGSPTNSMLAAEIEHFGADHQAYGRALSERWKFPRALSVGCGFHHCPMDAPDCTRTMPCIIHTADRVASRATGGFRLDLDSLEFDKHVLEELRISPDKAESLIERLSESLEDVQSMLA
ncbi:MAG: HDOD domain-containing protein [Phycisphaerales bacterium]